MLFHIIIYYYVLCYYCIILFYYSYIMLFISFHVDTRLFIMQRYAMTVIIIFMIVIHILFANVQANVTCQLTIKARHKNYMLYKMFSIVFLLSYADKCMYIYITVRYIYIYEHFFIKITYAINVKQTIRHIKSCHKISIL